MFHQICEHFEVGEKKTRLVPGFSTNFSVFEYLMKRSSLCLLAYFILQRQFKIWRPETELYGVFSREARCTITTFGNCENTLGDVFLQRIVALAGET